jgi:hypothetical protein
MEWDFIRTAGTLANPLKKKTMRKPGHFLEETAQTHFISGTGGI